MAVNGGRIDYTIGYKVDQTSVNNIKKSLDGIFNIMQNKSAWDLAIASGKSLQLIENIVKLADILDKALDEAFNPKLNTVNYQKLELILKQDELSVQLLITNFNLFGAVGQNASLNLVNSLSLVNLKLKEVYNPLEKLTTSLKRTLTWSVSSSIINSLSGKIQEAYGYVKNLDASLNDIRIVTGKSTDEMGKFAELANKAAASLGKGTTEYTNAALIFYQLGLSDAEVAARTETALKAASVTQLSTDAVSELLTAVWNGYKVSAEEAELYVDKIAAVAATTASNLEELSTGMSRVASSAQMMGVDIDLMNAILSTVISTTRQAPESVGTAFKTILARMSTIEAGGEDEDGANLKSYTEDMAALGINVLDSTNHLRKMGDVIEEVGGKWANMSKEQLIALALAMAGTRLYNNLVALFDNWDKHNAALATSQNAAGTLQELQEIYMNRTTAHLLQLTTAAEGVFDSIIDTSDLNGVIDKITEAIKSVEIFVDSFGGMKNIIHEVGALMINLFGKEISKTVTSIGVNIKNLMSNISLLKAMSNNISNLSLVTSPLLNELLNLNLTAMKQLKLGFMSNSLYEEYKKAVNELVNAMSNLNTKEELVNTAFKEIEKTLKTNGFKNLDLNIETADTLLDTLNQDLSTTITQLLDIGKVIEKDLNSLNDFNQKKILSGSNIAFATRQFRTAEGRLNVSTFFSEDKIKNDLINTLKNSIPLIENNGMLTNEIKTSFTNLFSHGILSINIASTITEEFNKIKESSENVDLSSLEQLVKRVTEAEENFKKVLFEVTHNGKDENGQILNETLAYQKLELALKNLILAENAYNDAATKGNAKGESTVATLIEELGEIQKLILRFKELKNETNNETEAIKRLRQELSNLLHLNTILGVIQGTLAIASSLMLIFTIIEQIKRLQENKDDMTQEEIIKTYLSIFITSLGVLLTLFPYISSGIAAIGTAGVIAGTSTTAAFGPIALIIIGIIAVVAVLTLAFGDFGTKAEKNLKQAQKLLDKTKEKTKELKLELDELVSSIDKFKDLKTELDDLTKGTDEWNNKVKEVNNSVAELLEKYPELIKYLQTENGIMSISDEGLEELQKAKQNEWEEELNKEFRLRQIVNEKDTIVLREELVQSGAIDTRTLKELELLILQDNEKLINNLNKFGFDGKELVAIELYLLEYLNNDKKHLYYEELIIKNTLNDKYEGNELDYISKKMSKTGAEIITQDQIDKYKKDAEKNNNGEIIFSSIIEEYAKIKYGEDKFNRVFTDRETNDTTITLNSGEIISLGELNNSNIDKYIKEILYNLNLDEIIKELSNEYNKLKYKSTNDLGYENDIYAKMESGDYSDFKNLSIHDYEILDRNHTLFIKDEEAYQAKRNEWLLKLVKRDTEWSSLSEGEAFNNLKSLEGYKYLTQDELDNLKLKIVDIYSTGGEKGLEEFLNEIKGKPIKAALEFEWEEEYEGVSKEIAKRLKKQNLTVDDFLRYRDILGENSDRGWSDDLILLYLESQKRVKDLLKNLSDIFGNLKLYGNDISKIEPKDINYLTEISSVLEAATGYKIDDKIIMENLDSILDYINGLESGYNKVAELATKAKKEKYSEQAVSEIFGNYKLAVGKKIKPELENLIREIGNALNWNEQQLDYIFAQYGYKKDETDNYVYGLALESKITYHSNKNLLKKLDKDKIITNDEFELALEITKITEELLKLYGWENTGDGTWVNSNNFTLELTYSLIMREIDPNDYLLTAGAITINDTSIAKLKNYGITAEMMDKYYKRDLNTNNGLYTWIIPEDFKLVQLINLVPIPQANIAERMEDGISADEFEELKTLLNKNEEELAEWLISLGFVSVDGSIYNWKKVVGALINYQVEINKELYGEKKPVNPAAVDAGNKTVSASKTKITKAKYQVNYDYEEQIIKDKQDELKRLQEMEKDLVGDDLIANLERLALLYELIAAAQALKNDLAREDLKTQRERVEALGAEFDDDGYIKNRAELLRNAENNVNGLKAKYNSAITTDDEGKEIFNVNSGMTEKEFNQLKESISDAELELTDLTSEMSDYDKALSTVTSSAWDFAEAQKQIASINLTKTLATLTKAVQDAADNYKAYTEALSDAESEYGKLNDTAKKSKVELLQNQRSETIELLKKEQLEVEKLALDYFDLNGDYAKERGGTAAKINDWLASGEDSITDPKKFVELLLELLENLSKSNMEYEKLVELLEEIEKDKNSTQEQIEAQRELVRLAAERVEKDKKGLEVLKSTNEQVKQIVKERKAMMLTAAEVKGSTDKAYVSAVDAQISSLGRLISRLQTAAKDLKGDKYAANIRKQNELIKKQAQLELLKLKLYQAQLKAKKDLLQIEIRTLATLLSKSLGTDIKLGVKFDADGNLDPTSIQTLSDSVASALASLGEEGAEVKTIWQEILSLLDAYQSLNGLVLNSKNAIEDYNLTIKDNVKDLAKKAKEELKKEMSKALTIFNAKVDIEVNIEDAWRQFNELVERVRGLKDFDILGNAQLDAKNLMEYLKANPNSYFGDAGGGSIQILTLHVNDIMSEIHTMLNGGTSLYYGKDQTTAFNDLSNYYNLLMSQVNAFYDKLDEVRAAYGKMIDLIISKNQELITDLETVNKLLTHNMNLTKLIDGEDAFGKFAAQYHEMAATYKTLTQEAINQKNYYAQLLASIDPDKNPEEYNKVKQAYMNAMDLVYSYGELLIETYHNELINKVADTNKKMEEELAHLAGYTNTLMLDLDWENWNWDNDNFLDPTNTLYEMTSLLNKFNDAIADTDSLRAKLKLTDVMNELLDILLKQLDDGLKLTKYDVDRANKVYELTLKLIALEEALNNKSKTRLRRDSQGNYLYEFVADEDKMRDATLDLLDAQNDLYNFDKNRAVELQKLSILLYKEYSLKVKEIAEDTTLSLEEKEEALNALKEEYANRLLALSKEYSDVRKFLEEDTDLAITVSNNTLIDTIAENYKRYEEMEENRINQILADLEHEKTEVDAAVAVISLGYASIDEAIQADIASMQELISYDEELIDKYKEELELITDLIAELEALEALYQNVMKAALDAVDAALRLRQTSWDDDEEEEESSSEETTSTTPKPSASSSDTSSSKPKKHWNYAFLGSGFNKLTKEEQEALRKRMKEIQAQLNKDIGKRAYTEAEIRAMIGSDEWNKSVKLWTSFDTGGYTGKWGKDGKLAVLHEKELVLNKDDTENMLLAVSIVRSLSGVLSNLSNMLDEISLTGMVNMQAPTTSAISSTLDLNVKIEAHFPNVQNANEIEKAFDNLIDLASQHAMRTRR